MGSKRKRSELSLSQKMEIIQLSEDKVSQTEISRRFECSRYTVSKIQKQKDELQSALENQNGSRKRRRVSETSDFDSAMRYWYCWKQFSDPDGTNSTLTAAIIEERSTQLALEDDPKKRKAGQEWMKGLKGKETEKGVDDIEWHHIGADLQDIPEEESSSSEEDTDDEDQEENEEVEPEPQPAPETAQRKVALNKPAQPKPDQPKPLVTLDDALNCVKKLRAFFLQNNLDETVLNHMKKGLLDSKMDDKQLRIPQFFKKIE